MLNANTLYQAAAMDYPTWEHSWWLILVICSASQFPLEKETFQFEPADFVYMLTFNAVCINLASLWLGLYFNGVPLILSCVYVWSKNFGEGNVSLCEYPGCCMGNKCDKHLCLSHWVNQYHDCLVMKVLYTIITESFTYSIPLCENVLIRLKRLVS
jgi:hypothetical protein